MKSKSFALVGAAGALIVTGAASAAFTEITGMKMDINPDPDVFTVQLFANFDNPADQLLAIGGIPGEGLLVFNSTHALINDDGGLAGTKAADFPGSPISGLFDSWVSINQLTFADGDTDYTPDFAGVPTSEQAILGTHWEEDDGGWFDSDPGTPEIGLTMIIAQFSVDPAATGTLAGLVNYTPAGGGLGFISTPFDVEWVPAPGAMALLGLAGLAGTRRRRR